MAVVQSPCPYHGCADGRVAVGSLPSFCSSCKQPVLFCDRPKCRAANRTLARYCRRCGAELGGYPIQPSLGVPPDADAPRFSETDSTVWQAPQSFAGFLWFLSAEGVLYRQSPMADRSAQAGVAGGDFGRSAFLIVEDLRCNPRVPAVVVADSRSVKVLSLVRTGRIDELCVLPAQGNGRFLTDTSETCCGIAHDRANFYLLGEQDGEKKLFSLPRTGGEPSGYALPGAGDEAVAGPVVLDSRVVCFADNRWYSLESGELSSWPWPTGFSPGIRRDEFRRAGVIRPAFTGFPFITDPREAYLLGNSNGSPALVVVSFDPSPVSYVIRIPTSSGILGQSADGSPLIAARGVVYKCQGPDWVRIKEDVQMVDTGLPFESGNLTVARIKTDVGREALRFYGRDGALGDWTLTPNSNYSEGASFLRCAGQLIHAFLTSDQRLRLVIWREREVEV
ncbi:MAG: hypothetical protein NTX53_20085 [candidate division WOR-3 bacterium]|nr:hypothetical protein [candidate division WOR-3 bacterium]